VKQPLRSCTLIAASIVVSGLVVFAASLQGAKKPAAPSAPESAAPAVAKPDVPELEFMTRLREEEFGHGEVMDIMAQLTDQIGPRLTGSPNMKKANEWTRDQVTKWGLANAHLEPWGTFGRGWAYQRCEVRMLSPDLMQFLALPKAWTPGTNGPIRGEVTQVIAKRQFYDDDDKAYNTVAEIQGTDPKLKEQLVMLGGHMDSWHAAEGATDNGAGTAVALEVVRLLTHLAVQPRRTIRIALWSGEEQGLLGSRGYVKEHFGSRPENTEPKYKDLPPFLRPPGGPLELKPDQKLVSVYFNLDNGSGKIRGVYLQGNASAAPIFEKWMQPFQDLGMTTLTMRNTGGTDHLSFDAVGIPGFQFIQDPLDYGSLTHHSNLDVYEHIRPDDMKQAAVIMASFVYNAAMRDEMMPRKPIRPEEFQPPKPEKEAEEHAEGDE